MTDQLDRFHDDPEIDLEIRQAFANADAARSAQREWKQKWILSAGVANGGALLALFTAMIGDKRPWELLPCGLFFLTGLTLAGLAPYAMVRTLYHETEFYWASGQKSVSEFHITADGVDYTASQYVAEMKRRLLIWMKATDRLTIASAAMFVVGGAAGLLLLTLKLFNLTLG